jgi:hypothetical protein
VLSWSLAGRVLSATGESLVAHTCHDALSPYRSYAACTHKSRKKAANKIFVGGLHWETTDGASGVIFF